MVCFLIVGFNSTFIDAECQGWKDLRNHLVYPSHFTYVKNTAQRHSAGVRLNPNLAEFCALSSQCTAAAHFLCEQLAPGGRNRTEPSVFPSPARCPAHVPWTSVERGKTDLPLTLLHLSREQSSDLCSICKRGREENSHSRPSIMPRGGRGQSERDLNLYQHHARAC